MWRDEWVREVGWRRDIDFRTRRVARPRVANPRYLTAIHPNTTTRLQCIPDLALLALEAQRDAVDAVALVGGGVVSLALEDVAGVSFHTRSSCRGACSGFMSCSELRSLMWLLCTLCRLVQCETHPRWPPLSVSLNFTAVQQTHQLAQTISVRVIKFELSSRRITAPGTVSKNAGHPQPDALASAMS